MASRKKVPALKKQTSALKRATKAEHGPRVTSKDFQIAFLTSGMDGVEKLDDSPAARSSRRAVLLRTIEDLRRGGQGVVALEEYVDSKYEARVRGRVVPTVGAERGYKVQQLRDDSVFLRLPLSTLAVKKGAIVNVSFEADRVVVTKG